MQPPTQQPARSNTPAGEPGSNGVHYTPASTCRGNRLGLEEAKPSAAIRWSPANTTPPRWRTYITLIKCVPEGPGRKEHRLPKNRSITAAAVRLCWLGLTVVNVPPPASAKGSSS
jgi:hypothetical protein